MLRSQARDLDALPHDLCQAGRRIDFDLTDIFPNLSYPVVDALNRCHFDVLFNAQQQYSPSRMGDNQTKDFILLHVFEIEPKVIKHPAHLLHTLLRLHYQKTDMPALLTARFIQVLARGRAVCGLAAGSHCAGPSGFLRVHAGAVGTICPVRRQDCRAEGQERPADYGLKYPGPGLLPFDHHDVRVYLDHLFAEGL